MLSDNAKSEIREAAASYPRPRAAALEALHVIQRDHGWVSDEHLREAADLLEMSADELDGVASFYSLIFRRPVGRHVILTCDGISCWVLRSERLVEALTARLGIRYGETTPDGRFTLLPVACLGACDHAPVLMIDRDLHRDVSPDMLDSILEKYR
jgi:NADH-quinone oxidoreductase subunit E